ncbi:MAG: virulence factor [Myxococcota bacterium]|jgi:hypothetical protein|nr:virulence factor [Myxococcota bacterium]
MNRLITIYWRDIPSRVVGRRGRKSLFKQTLDSRFDRAIERAARRGGGGSSKQYLEDWRRESRSCSSELEKEVAEEVARLEAQFPPDTLEKLVRAAGIIIRSES